MIKFFRRLRQQLLSESKFTKYLIYAIGEIVLVVIGILIALQINNWNEERVQEKELDGLKKSISSAIASDVKYLKLIRTARESFGDQSDSILKTYIINPKTVLVYDDFAFISEIFRELDKTIYYQPNLSAFEALKNSIYLSKLQNTDMELLLNSFYAAAERLQKQEENYNQSLKILYQAWLNKFRNKDADLIMSFWKYLTDDEIQERFLKVLNDELTKTLLTKCLEESAMIDVYDQQITLGEKYVEMVEKGELNFDAQTKIDFSGTFYSYAEIDVLNLLVNGKIPPDFGMIYAHSGKELYEGIVQEDEALMITYPEKMFEWGAPYFKINALKGRVKEMDFTRYKNLSLEMKGELGGEQFTLMMKDKYDPPDGSESRVDITLTNTWEKFEVPIDQFETADKKIIEIPMGFVFIGDEGKTIYIRSIQLN